MAEQPLHNRIYFYRENEKLEEDVDTLNKELDDTKKSSVNTEYIENLKMEKNNLLALNERLQRKLKYLRHYSPTKQSDFVQETKEKKDLFETVKELDRLIEKFKRNEIFEIKQQDENHTANLINSLTIKIEEEEKKSEQLNEIIRKLRNSDEKYILEEKLTDLKQLLTDLEKENSKLKYENEQLLDNIENFKNQLNQALEDVKIATKKCYTLEDDKDQLKKIISDLENEKTQIKKDMDEMNETNAVNKVPVDTELALEHISEAYEMKRREVKQLMEQLVAAENIIKEFQKQFKSLYT
ncbi:unnamed protein product [Psylliodes chrysocephalus]|uniref:Uncharacterized protein n=1 Tax=Psylliodes chrysocephalus TaxID=3402493 RepID=A0A9P0CRS3_9CUCU|nr:unnamed protein product [Psylliodes chrysocephala]